MLNQEQLREKLKNENLSKSQRKHLKKIIKKRDRRDKHINKLIESQMNSTKLIEENHSGGDYSCEFTMKAEDYYVNYFWNSWVSMVDDPNRFLYSFQKIRPKLQTLLLKWPFYNYPRNQNFDYFKSLLDTYRENKGSSGELLLKISYSHFKNIGKFK